MAGLSLAGAAAIQESFFGGVVLRRGVFSGGSNLSLDSGAGAKSIQNVTVQIYNPYLTRTGRRLWKTTSSRL